MKKFIFRESKDKNVLAFISVATVLMLVYAFAIALLNDKCELSGIGFYLAIIFGFLIFVVAIIWYLKKKIIVLFEYEISEDGIKRTNHRTNESCFYNFSEIQSIDNDKFTYMGRQKEYLRIKFRNSNDYLTFQSEGYNNDLKDEYFEFKSLFYSYLEQRKDEISPSDIKYKRSYSNLMLYIAIICLVVLIIFPVLLIITGKTHKYMGLIPLYIAFLPIIYLGFSSKKWRK
jgi:hypothetical protein